MRGTKDQAPKLRASTHCKSALTVGSGDVLPKFTCGRTSFQGDTTVKGRKPHRGPLQRTLQRLPVIGLALDDQEAKEWADIIRHEFRGK